MNTTTTEVDPQLLRARTAVAAAEAALPVWTSTFPPDHNDDPCVATLTLARDLLDRPRQIPRPLSQLFRQHANRAINDRHLLDHHEDSAELVSAAASAVGMALFLSSNDEHGTTAKTLRFELSLATRAAGWSAVCAGITAELDTPIEADVLGALYAHDRNDIVTAADCGGVIAAR